MGQISVKVSITCLGALILFVGTLLSVSAQKPRTSTERDAKVEKFLKENREKWDDWNVPYEDGRVLYNLIIKNNYRRALEIGTSRAIRPYGWPGG